MRNKWSLFLAQNLSTQAVQNLASSPSQRHKRGILFVGGISSESIANTVYAVQVLRYLTCQLPVEYAHLDTEPLDFDGLKQLSENKISIRSFSAPKDAVWSHRNIELGSAKPTAILTSPFQQLIFMDPDILPLQNPSSLFQTPEFIQTGALFWPDYRPTSAKNKIWAIMGFKTATYTREWDSGFMVLDKQNLFVLNALRMAQFLCNDAKFYFNYFWGDKEAFRWAFAIVGRDQAAKLPDKAVGRSWKNQLFGLLKHKTPQKEDLNLTAENDAKESIPATQILNGGAELNQSAVSLAELKVDNSYTGQGVYFYINPNSPHPVGIIEKDLKYKPTNKSLKPISSAPKATPTIFLHQSPKYSIVQQNSYEIQPSTLFCGQSFLQFDISGTKPLFMHMTRLKLFTLFKGLEDSASTWPFHVAQTYIPPDGNHELEFGGTGCMHVPGYNATRCCRLGRLESMEVVTYEFSKVYPSIRDLYSRFYTNSTTDS
ncbi:mannosyltransferase putative-domain-containing protein [Obelidium mucronatum]|nr:mannosyltransferase putative-domain-containing protein [Obelidium mucronatum]